MGKIKVEGAVDLHCHYGPDFINPAHNLQASVTAIQAAQEAADAGFAAIVLKSHDFPTAALAYTLNQVVPNMCGLSAPSRSITRSAASTFGRWSTPCAWAPK